MFLARATQQQDEISHENMVNHLESEYNSKQEQQDYGMEEEINFLHEDDLDKLNPRAIEEDQSDFL